MPRATQRSRVGRLLPLAIATVLLLPAADLTLPLGALSLPVPTPSSLTSGSISQEPPEELRGEVTVVSGDRIHINLSQQEWLPPAGVPVVIGEEMAGMWVPLDGPFVIIQVNADSVVAQAVGAVQPGDPARGMQARIETVYPNRPQSTSSYRESEGQMAAILSMAEGGDPIGQYTAGMSYEGRGDHDNALVWWERAQAATNDRFVLAQSAVGRAEILALRGQHQEALTILQGAASRTEPSSNELTCRSYSGELGGEIAMALEWHVLVLENIGHIYRAELEDIAEANRWFRAAAEVKGTSLRNGVPAPSDPTHEYYLMTLNSLASFYQYALEDQEAAIPWLQTAARAGDTRAQEQLTRMGISW